MLTPNGITEAVSKGITTETFKECIERFFEENIQKDIQRYCQNNFKAVTEGFPKRIAGETQEEPGGLRGI